MQNSFPSVHGRTSWTNSARPSRVTVPDSGHPHARLVFEEMVRQGVTYSELEHRSGVLISTIKAWRGNPTRGRAQNQPGLASLAAVLGALGWAYVPVPRLDMLPTRIREGLDRLNDEWSGDEPLLHQLLATACLAPIAVGGNA